MTAKEAGRLLAEILHQRRVDRLNRWTQSEWAQAFDGLESQGVDMPAMIAQWGTSVNPLEQAWPDELDKYGWDEDDVILDADRHQWVLGVLASELEPHPIPA
jgi:hypothetical protein